MYAQCPQCALGGLHAINRLIHSEIPESDFAITAGRDQLSHAASLHVDVRDPLLMVAPCLYHRSGGFQSLVVDSNSAVAEPSNKYVPGYLIGRQRCNARARASRDILDKSANVIARIGDKVAYICADFSRSVPHFDNFDIASNQRLTLPLLPIENKPSVFVTRNEIR